MNIIALSQAAAQVAPWATAIRQTLHQIPELRWEETKTLDAIRESVLEIDRSNAFVYHSAEGGIWYDYIMDENLPFRLFRADVDGLPIMEKSGVPFASLNGCMHACGHDVHPAMLLGSMKAIADGNVKPTKNIRFVFQRAEENPITPSGGRVLVEEGVLNNVEDAHALHVWPEKGFPAGTFGYRSGVMLANSDRVHIVITCAHGGGHVAYPNQGSNAVDIAADILVGLRGFGERYFDPGEQYSFVPAMVQVGKTSNTRPGKGEIWLSARNFRDDQGRTEFEKAIQNRVAAVAGAYPDAKAEVKYVRGHPMLYNNPEDVETIHILLKTAELDLKKVPLVSGGEDFAHYLKECPGSMWLVGVYQDGCGPIHSETFNPDEKGIEYGILFWLLLATQQ